MTLPFMGMVSVELFTTMATANAGLSLLSVCAYVRAEGRTCFIQSIDTSLGFRQYFLVDIDSGVRLKKAWYELEPLPDTALAVYRRVTEPENQKVGVTAHIGGFMAGKSLSLSLSLWALSLSLSLSLTEPDCQKAGVWDSASQSHLCRNIFLWKMAFCKIKSSWLSR